MPSRQQLRQRRQRLRKEARILGQRRRDVMAEGSMQPYAPPQRDPSQYEDAQSTLSRRDTELGYAESTSELDKARARQQEDVERADVFARENEQQDIKATRRQGSEQGLLFSGVLGQRVGEVTQRYGREREGRQRELQRSLADIEERRQQLGQRRQLALDQIRMGATERGVAAAAQEAEDAPAYTQGPADPARLAKLARRVSSRQSRIARLGQRIGGQRNTGRRWF